MYQTGKCLFYKDMYVYMYMSIIAAGVSIYDLDSCPEHVLSTHLLAASGHKPADTYQQYALCWSVCLSYIQRVAKTHRMPYIAGHFSQKSQ